MKELLNRPMAEIVEEFTANVNNDEFLKEYRDFIEHWAFGFGERCFLWMWTELVALQPKDFTFVEIGVFRGQILALIEKLAEVGRRDVTRYGITPLDSSDGHWESDYMNDIARLHDRFGITKNYHIIKGSSTDRQVIAIANNIRGIDLLYIDGGHAYDVVKSDLAHYPPMVKRGGYLVIDDCNNSMEMPDGYFRGIESVSRAVDEMFPPFAINDEWEYIGSVVHNRILRRR